VGTLFLLTDARTHEPRAVLDAATRKSVSVTDFKPKLSGNNWVSCLDCDEYDTWMVFIVPPNIRLYPPI
jgi:hypothetical protein